MLGASKSSRTGACSTILPAYMTATRSHIFATMPRLCVTKMSATPVSCWMSFSMSRYCAWIVTSRLVVGSSAMIELGPAGQRDRADDALAHAAAHLVRVLPHAHRGDGIRTARSSSLHALAQGAAAVALVEVGGLGDLAVDREQRIRATPSGPAGSWRSARRGSGASRAGCLRVRSSPSKRTRPPTIAAARAAAARRSTCSRGLAASGLADEPEGLALARRKADAVDRLDHARAAEGEDASARSRDLRAAAAMPVAATVAQLRVEANAQPVAEELCREDDQHDARARGRR